MCRTDRFLDQDLKRKIALFCDVDEEAVITAKDVSSIYEVPLVLGGEGLDRILLQRLHLPETEARMDAWVDLVDRIKHPTDEVTIHVVGKYVGYEDSTRALNRALYHGGLQAPAAGTFAGWRPKPSNSRAANNLLGRLGRDPWCRAASATGATRGMMQARDHRAPVLSAAFRISASDRLPGATVEYLPGTVCGQRTPIHGVAAPRRQNKVI